MVPAPDARQLDLHAQLLEALDHDPFVRFEVDAGTLERIVTEPGTAVAWVGRHRSGLRWATGLAADPSDSLHVSAAAYLVATVVGASSGPAAVVGGVTVTRGGRHLLPEALQPPTAWEWDFWWLDREPEPVALVTSYGERVEVVDLPAADPRIGPLIALASPDAPLRPGDPRVVRWAGVEDPEGGLTDTGGLAAVLAVTHHRSGADHLNDVATHPDRRGRGLARLLCGRVATDSLRAGAPAVTLGMYADNDSARRVYTALGFTCVRGQTSGPLHPQPPADPHSA